MNQYEKLGLFYLGKTYDLSSKVIEEDLILVKSKDLTTHAVIIGMTGSGKTGLGIGLLEEALMDDIPVIAIDPKGDIANLALTFPNLRGSDFEPWINGQEASNKGYSLEEYAEQQADTWKRGLSDWGQDGQRIESLKSKCEIAIYTPGGSGGIGVSLLKSFNAPDSQVLDDRESFREYIGSTATSLLTLIGVDADPFTSRDYILLSSLLEHSWNQGVDLSLQSLILSIQTPTITKIGVMDIESFYPAKERFGLAMRFNNLLASPGFESWLEGESLDIDSFLYSKSGKPKASVFSIAHLGDTERMFFVTLLLNEMVTWMRKQQGTNSLRALLYMDEVFGYLPPTANPPSKTPLLTLLKQARAFGLGLVLSTQNPVDLDYKALSNAGTWFIGRLQTERDKERVIAGLEGAASGASFDKAKTEQILAGMGQRVFYLHSVHQPEPQVFTTRWTMSYLAGPLAKSQLLHLKQPVLDRVVSNSAIMNTETKHAAYASTQPVLSPNIEQVYLPANCSDVTYQPGIIGIADVLYSSSKHSVSSTLSYTFIAPIHDGPIPIDWEEAKGVDIPMRDLKNTGEKDAVYMEIPQSIANDKSFDAYKKLLIQHLKTNVALKLFYSKELKLVSGVNESERDFSVRLKHAMHEKRDESIDALKSKYSSKIQTLENRLERAELAIEKESAKASQKKLDALVSTGSAVLGALLGKKKVTASSVSKIGTAVRRTSTAMSSGQGIEQARENYENTVAQLDELNLELASHIDRLSAQYDEILEQVETIEIRPTQSNITVHLVGVVWEPLS